MVPFTDTYKYVGVTLHSMGMSLFKLNYSLKAQTGRVAAAAAFSLNSVVGPLDPSTGRKLHIAQIDPHLTAACDICVDFEKTHLQELERVQQTFIRRFGGLGDKALTAFLYKETGIWPLAYRRISLAVKFLEYIIQLPDSHLAKIASVASSNLATESGARCWYSALQTLLRDSAGFDLPFLPLVTPGLLASAYKAIRTHMYRSLRQKLSLSPKAYLVRDIQIEDDNGRLSSPALYFRQYLLVARRSHKVTLTKLLLSDHALTSERDRWLPKSIRPERSNRKCRVCQSAPETPEHILFICSLPINIGALTLRRSICTKLSWLNVPTNEAQAILAIRQALRLSHTVAELAELAYTTYKYLTVAFVAT
ncbi:hypothetical protein FRB90_000048 [Tulasnella sp. 427]|nr:hypothetical protein FRB90_000048 [Tulasnella sp. 427]